MNDETDLTGEHAEVTEDLEAIASNIEHYLNNHTREGGQAWQMNMAARPEAWHPLEVSSESPSIDSTQV